MLCYPQHKGRNYFQTEEKSKKKEFHVNSTLNTFQRKYDDFD